uniref:Uncharacterized protein n=1 Tax=Arsenophonus nasoniae TaxID=638 RepID=D2U1C5_9GAMM|nr:hypothetical protein ARN_23410 [Arsenophonus nasoniae]
MQDNTYTQKRIIAAHNRLFNMIKYINIFIRLLLLIVVFPIILYLSAIRYVNENIDIWESKAEDIISSIQKFLDKYFPVRSK